MLIDANVTDTCQHFILTRFNLRIWRQDKHGSAVRTREWLEHRFGLFEKYCLPSIANQTCKDFEWVVLFDDKTPDEFRNRISEYHVLPSVGPFICRPRIRTLLQKSFPD